MTSFNRKIDEAAMEVYKNILMNLVTHCNKGMLRK